MAAYSYLTDLFTCEYRVSTKSMNKQLGDLLMQSIATTATDNHPAGKCWSMAIIIHPIPVSTVMTTIVSDISSHHFLWETHMYWLPCVASLQFPAVLAFLCLLYYAMNLLAPPHTIVNTLPQEDWQTNTYLWNEEVWLSVHFHFTIVNVNPLYIYCSINHWVGLITYSACINTNYSILHMYVYHNTPSMYLSTCALLA